MLCSEKRARLLLERGRARVDKMYPFTIRLVDRKSGDTQPLILKVDPGSKQTGLTIVREDEATTTVVALFALKHRSAAIGKSLKRRAGFRRRRRSANLRYRAPRFDNRRKPKGWLAPSVRLRTLQATVACLRRLALIAFPVQELVRFDMQWIENPEISRAEYQNGTLAGYELREYLLEKGGRRCAYCDAKDVPLNLDHVHPKAAGGSNRESNLTLACIGCNQKKGIQTN
jgi:5-methylcytosine-specific restriction endonuclease McrA